MKERKTVRKWYWVWDFDKEEQWLNTMAQSGWLLDKVSFCTYHFIACSPGEYTIRSEMRNYDQDYLCFMQETGAEYIGRMQQWIYFRKKAINGEFNLFSDIDSKIHHLDKIGKTLWFIGCANLMIGLANTLNPSFHSSPIGWINLLCATLLMYALGRIHGKKETLQTQRLLLE